MPKFPVMFLFKSQCILKDITLKMHFIVFEVFEQENSCAVNNQPYGMGNDCISYVLRIHMWINNYVDQGTSGYRLGDRIVIDRHTKKFMNYIEQFTRTLT